MPKIKKIKATVMFGHIVPHSASDEAHLWPQQHDHDHCCQPRRSALECSGSSVSIEVGSGWVRRKYKRQTFKWKNQFASSIINRGKRKANNRMRYVCHRMQGFPLCRKEKKNISTKSGIYSVAYDYVMC